MSESRAVRSEDRDPILGLQPCLALIIARGWRKGPLRVPQPLTGTALPTRPGRETLWLLPRFGREALQRPAVQQPSAKTLSTERYHISKVMVK
ncbi:hypothetical protein NDU88_000351 [Pleurodeles waltl]|uniref:Uncharacterized protein n=1 Tax=Pleurodeles waltl TaxID=8319 RepID=A0AAV7USU5_PLEWA|nr:hypothetical protein NDU88_000351 [Pleurodeles waltl]